MCCRVLLRRIVGVDGLPDYSEALVRSFRTDAGEGRAVAVEPEFAEKFLCQSLISVSMRFRHIRLAVCRLRTLVREWTFIFVLVR